MPLISIDAVHPTKEQKEKLIAGLTKTASEILGVDEKFFTYSSRKMIWITGASAEKL